MNNLWSAILRNPKKVMLTLSVITAGLIPVALNAWGPSRPEYSRYKVAQEVVFNSITDNPTWGDEFNFVRVKEAGTESNWVDKIAVTPSKKYTVFVFYHNNAATALNLIAKDVRMNTQLPAEIAAGGSGTISAKVMASNAKPQTVWDEAYLTSANNVTVKYVQNSATIHNLGTINGSKLNQDNLFLTTGALLGYNAFDGKVQGCSQYSGYVSYDVLVEEKVIPKPDFRIEKTVAIAGTTDYKEQVSVKDNSNVTFRVEYKNIGNTTQNNVVIKDVMPSGMTYVAGTTYLANMSSNGQKKLVSDNIMTANGLNIGNYTAGSNAYVYFTAKMNDLDCGKTDKLINTAKIVTDDGSKTDNAEVIVKADECPVVKKIEVCELATKKVITIDETIFNSSKHSKNLDDCKTVPVELPHTGMDSTLGEVAGLGALVTSSVYYISSKRQLK